MESSYPRRRTSERQSSSNRQPPPRGSHNRPWQAEDEYIKTIRRNHEEEAPSTTDSFERYMAHKQRQLDEKLEESQDYSTKRSSRRPSDVLQQETERDKRHTPRRSSESLLAQQKKEELRRRLYEEQRRGSEEQRRSSENRRHSESTRRHSEKDRPEGKERRRSSREEMPSADTTSSSSERRRSSAKPDLSSSFSREDTLSSRELRARRLRTEQERRSGEPMMETSASRLELSHHSASSNRSSDNGHSSVPPSPAASPRDYTSKLAAESAAKRESLAKYSRQQQLEPSAAKSPPLAVVKTTETMETRPRDEVPKTHDDAVKGWSTLSRRRSSEKTERPMTAAGKAVDPYAKVDQYLAQRSKPIPKIESAPSTDSSQRQSLDTDDSSSDESLESELSDDESSIDDEQTWSVKVCVVSAVDFPANVVPNLPFSPVLRAGLVNTGVDLSDKTVEEKKRKEILSKISQHGLQSVSKTRVHCTGAKILSKRDNGSVEYHEEMRWDRVKNPEQMAIALELSARAVMTPRNIKESPPAQKADRQRLSITDRGTTRTDKASSGVTAEAESAMGMSTLGSLFRRPSAKRAGRAEMETANAAAAVAKLLVDEKNSEPSGGPLASNGKPTSVAKALACNQSEIDVKLRPRKRRRRAKMTEDLALGSQLIPLNKLPLKKALLGRESARIEQWFELESSSISKASGGGSPSGTSKRNPSVLVEITFCSPEVLDESEDEMNEGENADRKASFSKRASNEIRTQLKEENTEKKPVASEEPELEPGIIDYVCVVGARDIGSQKADDGSSGWVDTVPECCVLEQFPPSDEYERNGRSVVIPNKVEWFCFPEGCRLWRGTTPPNLDELNLKRFSASSPANISTSIASFDACLSCTTSFSWFVISSNSDEYGSENVKTYGAVIRFFVPAPAGIDPTQDDFAQMLVNAPSTPNGDVHEGKRLWVPLGICMTSSIPIVGTMEAMLLRLCEAYAASGVTPTAMSNLAFKLIHQDLINVIFKFQRPIPGVVHCSVPFLKGDRFHLSVPPRGGLPTLPHGNAIASVCRLLGADGLNFMLAALLTECKILIHSDDIANLCLVAEVMTALIYPFTWSLPYIPVLPAEMMEFLEAPLSFLLGVPTCNMKYVDPLVIEDIVVVDLDKDFSTAEYIEKRRTGISSKTPIPLPATVASNISKAVYRLLRAEEEADDESSEVNFSFGMRSFPRMEPESQAEREFRVAVAMEICGLLRGYQDCLVYASSSQPVFNIDRFLQIAPALFEEQRGTLAATGSSQEESASQFVLSPRSRRFMSLLVNCQHFHQFLEVLESDGLAFFHEVMSAINTSSVTRRAAKRSGHVLSLDFHKSVESLCTFLQKLEDKVPTYRVSLSVEDIDEDERANDWVFEELPHGLRFPLDILQQIALQSKSDNPQDTPEKGEGVRQVSIEYLMELEKNPWRYRNVFDVPLTDNKGRPLSLVGAKVKLRDAIGERRYRAWKLALEQEKFDADEISVLSDDSKANPGQSPLDLNSLLTSATADLTSIASDLSGSTTLDSKQGAQSLAQRRVADAKDRDTLRRCLEKALAGATSDSFKSGGRNLVTESESALRNPSARAFLLSVLSKRATQESDDPKEKRRSTPSGSSKLDPAAFDVLVRLGCAMLDACIEARDYDSAYSMLKLTAGIYTITGENDNDVAVAYMTRRMGLHPIYADLGVWDRAKELHILARKEAKVEETAIGGPDGEIDDEEDGEYEAAVATLYEMLGYGIPAEELARFASHVSEANGWFQSERGQALLLLARRLSVRRESGAVVSAPEKKSDIELMSPRKASRSVVESANVGDRSKRRSLCVNSGSAREEDKWIETSWCHPASQSSRRSVALDATAVRRSGTQSLLNMLDEQKVLPGSKRHSLKHMKRSAITSLAYLGSSVVVTGGLDGGVFMARKVKDDNETSLTDSHDNCGVRGVHLDWGSSGSRFTAGSSSSSLDGEYGVGAVTCLAATRGNSPATALVETRAKDVTTPLDEEELLEAMDGCRVVAGTTCGDLRVWVVKDVLSAVFYSSRDVDSDQIDTQRQTHREGISSTLVSSRRKGTTDFAAGSSLTRLKFSLRGRALSGHRGGVSCIDVPSSLYRPDSIISGGADGLIKLWSLRSPGGIGGRRHDAEQMVSTSPIGASPRGRAAQNGDALSILSGHGGRVICVKTAWHGDRLLSGGADRTVRVWDLAGSGGKCLNSLSGHFGWVTHVQYWGPNTIISASTDRSIALWDARVRNTPLFSLRHHYAPVSDLLVGARTDPIMISAANDGTVAAWDFRHLSGSDDKNDTKKKKGCQIVRNPPGRLYLHDYSTSRHVCGPVLLSRGPSRDRKTASCIGSDTIIREWDYETGEVVSEHVTGHCDLVSNFVSVQGNHVYDTQLESSGFLTGTITTSWDGTVRCRTRVSPQ